jgi:hypothetical protein
VQLLEAFVVEVDLAHFLWMLGGRLLLYTRLRPKI